MSGYPVLSASNPSNVKNYVLHSYSSSDRNNLLGEYSEYVFACKDAGIIPKSPPLVDLAPDVVSRQRFSETGCSSEKLFRCGEIWERYTFYDKKMNRKRFAHGFSQSDDDIKNAGMQAFNEYRVRRFLEEFTGEEPEEPEKQEKRHMTEEEKKHERQRRKRKQKKAVQRYVNLNRLHYMYTFTFALEENEGVKGLRFILLEENQRDRGEVEKVWNKRLTCIRRALKRQGREFKFVKVLEKHNGKKTDPRKRGTYHIHLATDKPIDKEELQTLWGYGVVWVDNFNKSKKRVNGKAVNVEREGAVNDPGRYMSKYMDKDFDDAEKHGYRRAYSPSQNLKVPQPDRDEEMNQAMIDTPRLGFQEEELDPLLWKRICQLVNAEKVKTFEKTYPIKFVTRDKTGEEKIVKMFVKYECFNFRLLKGLDFFSKKN